MNSNGNTTRLCSGNLARIGLPEYELRNGKVWSLRYNRPMKINPNGTYNLTIDGRMVRFVDWKMQYAFEHNVSVFALRSNYIVKSADGRIVERKEILEQVRKRRTEKNKTRTEREQLQYIEESMQEMNILREAIETGDSNRLVADLYAHAEPTKKYLSHRFKISDSERLDEIFSEAVTIVLETIFNRHAFVSNYTSLLMQTAKWVASAESDYKKNIKLKEMNDLELTI